MTNLDLDAVQKRVQFAVDSPVDVALLEDIAYELLAEVERLGAQVEHLHTWDGLMSVVDEYYPTTVFPVLPDDDRRDSMPRILSLLRRLDETRTERDLRADEAIRFEVWLDRIHPVAELAKAWRDDRSRFPLASPRDVSTWDLIAAVDAAWPDRRIADLDRAHVEALYDDLYRDWPGEPGLAEPDGAA